MAAAVAVRDEPKLSAAVLFRDRQFLLLWLGQTISNLGDAALLIAVPVTIYDATNSRGALSLVTIAAAAPTLLLGLFAGAFVDRWDRRRTMIVSDLGRAAAVLLMLGAHRGHTIWMFYVATGLVAAFSSFFTPARAGIMKAILPRKRLLQANALITSGTQISGLFGPALGGALLSFVHAEGVFLFDAGTFLVSALCISLVTTPSAAVNAPRVFGGVWRDMKDGLHYLARSPMLSGMMALLGTVIIGAEISNILEYAFVKDVWHVPHLFGYLMAIFGVGMIVAGLLVSGPLRNTEPITLVAWAFGTFTIGGLSWAWSPNPTWGALALFIFGLGYMLICIPLMTLFQTTASQEMIGRVTATRTVISRIAMLVAGGVAAALMHVPLRPVFVGLSIVYGLCMVLTRPLLAHRTVASTVTPDV